MNTKNNYNELIDTKEKSVSSITSSIKSKSSIKFLKAKTIGSLIILFLFAGYLIWCFIDNFYKMVEMKKENKKLISIIKGLKSQIQKISKESQQKGFTYKALQQKTKIESKENLNLLKKYNAEENKKRELEKYISSRKISYKESENEYEKKKNYINLSLSASENLKRRIKNFEVKKYRT